MFSERIWSETRIEADLKLCLDKAIRTAIILRLRLRQGFIRNFGEGLRAEDNPMHLWVRQKSSLPALRATHHLGKAAWDAFNEKLPKSLPMSLPPRKPASVEFLAASQDLEAMLSDLETVEMIRINLKRHPGLEVLQVCSSLANLERRGQNDMAKFVPGHIS